MRKFINFNLKKYNTFTIEQFAKLFWLIEKPEDLNSIEFKNDFFILGGGSNILITRELENVIHLNYECIKIIENNDKNIVMNITAGTKWDDFVSFCVQRGFYGVENLSAIPGTVGAAPVQNIGAYGVEVADVIFDVGIYEITTRKFKKLTKNECNFAYRDSIFKNELKNKVIITDVTFKLQKDAEFRLNYGGLKNFVGKNPDLKKVRNAIIEIRKNKLPDINKTGNAGSFFKNPVINESKLCELAAKYDDLKYFKVPGGFKVPAAWLIEKAGLKGFRHKNAAVSEKHSLILVNLGKATAKDILELDEIIKKRIFEMFGIKLTEEVNIV